MKFKLLHLFLFVFLIALGLWRYTQQSVVTARFEVTSFDLIESEGRLYGNCDVEIRIPGRRRVKHHISIQGAPLDWIVDQDFGSIKESWVRYRSQHVWPLERQSPYALIYRNLVAESLLIDDPNLDVPLEANNQIMVMVEMLE